MKSIYSVGQINTYIRNMFAQDYLLHQVAVRGEVSNCKYHSSGHIYFTLKDTSGTLSCVMFAGRRRGLSFTMREGDQVIVTGAVDVYERDGRYQLYADRIIRDGAGKIGTLDVPMRLHQEDFQELRHLGFLHQEDCQGLHHLEPLH